MKRFCLSIVLVISILVCCSCTSQQKYDQLRSDYDDLESEYYALEDEYYSLLAEYEDLESKIYKLEEENGTQRVESWDLESEISELEEENRELRRKEDTAGVMSEMLYEALLLVDVYRGDDWSFWYTSQPTKDQVVTDIERIILDVQNYFDDN